MSKIKFDNNKSVIPVFVNIKNKGSIIKLKMVLDTGASSCMIPWKVVDILELHPELSKKKIDITTASGVLAVPLLTVDSITVSNNTVNNVKVIIHDLPPKSFVDGLLGASFLNKFELCINYKQGYFELKK